MDDKQRISVRIDGNMNGQLVAGNHNTVVGTGLGGAAPEPANPGRPIRILFLAANPVDTEALRLDEEMRAIDGALREAEFRDRFEVRQQWAVRIGDLQEALLRHRPDIVHFSGHGTNASEIVLASPTGAAQPVPSAALERLFAVLADDIRCVVLNACYSEPQAEAIARHIDCVVGMTQAVGDDAAIEFATGFYRALAYGRSVQTAFELGANQIALQGLPDEATPHLVATKANAADVVFVTAR
jgi:CHAT domain-containing protein